ncbi:HTH-type transcriptional regulator KmtR [Ensifer sp. M14]|uniref:ArsR/SmtB family transcription factor n=1 Tax=Ensifer sp. M14 TaxID=2203782 RepID=UPI000E1CE703|nr:metalloregulator ArsR/SmtB family transcription factor [Ensifer sp. M14]RDL52731.1 HTH-type transcriptional regulator KmtR [Ensifer sp. M14]
MTDLQLQIFEELAELARTLASAQRLMLLEHIAQGERSVERLAELAGLSIANASQHLQQLRRAGFVETRRDGKRVLYRLGTGPVIGLLSALRQHAEHNRAQIRELVANRLDRPERLEAISREELLFRMGEGSVTLLDVRPQDEFASGHLPGAINIPIDELERRLAELPAGAEIVAYCRGPYCALSFDAVTVLRGKGFAVRRLDSGFPDWKAAGLSVEGRDPG